jgi:hypothetical protein
MTRNLEKFGAPKHMKKRTLEEGVADYEEQREEEMQEINKKANDIINFFYAEDLVYNPDFSLSEELDKYSKKNKRYREPASDITCKEKPQFDDVGWMINFIDHIVNEETWSKYFTDQKATKAFRKIININALNEEFSRAQNQESSNTVSLEFIPTRGLLMEFSGHIADACWASKYDSIAESFPNIVAVTMVQNKGTKNERLAGSCMLIETETVDGTPLLVIRGLNPIQNVINAISTNDFFEKFTNYLQTIAKKQERELAIVIDNNSGGSATNRPVLFQLLAGKKESLKRAQLSSAEDTTFNGYDVTNNTYFV